MPRKPRWYDALPEATATVDCNGEPHPVTWRRGKLVLEAHDLTAERAMLAFGGDLCPCMRVLEMWVEQFRMPPDMFGQMHTWLGENAFLLPTEFALPRRLGMVLTWERAWRFAAWLPTKQAELLHAELEEKARGPLRDHTSAWKSRTGARVIPACQVVLVPPTRPAVVDGTTDRVAMRVTAQLHARWMVNVWPRGTALVDDAFVMELVEAVSPNELRVVAVRWEPTGTGTWATVAAPAEIRRESGTEDWHLTWEDAPDAPESTVGGGPAGLGPPPAATGVVRSTRVPGAEI